MSNNDNNTPAHTIEEGSFANLILTGKGYLNNPRWFSPAEGSNSLWVSIAAQRGKAKKDPTSGKVKYSKTGLDCRVVGENLIQQINGLLEKYDFTYDAKDRPVVKLGFVVGDAYPFMIRNEHKPGEPRQVIKGRLIQITWMTVNGELVYGSFGSDSANADDEGVDTASDSEAQPKAGHASSQANASSDCPFDEVPGDEVHLSKDDPDFTNKKAWLKANGYRWNKDTVSWFRPEAEAA